MNTKLIGGSFIFAATLAGGLWYMSNASGASVDPLLTDEQTLLRGGFLKDGAIPVVIDLDMSQEIQNSVSDSYLNEYSSRVASLKKHLGETFASTLELKITGAIAGKLIYNPPSLNLLKSAPGVKNVFVDRKTHILLNESPAVMNVSPIYNETDPTGRKIKGDGITIAVLDTGIDATHPDLDDLDDDLLTNDPKVVAFFNTLTTEKGIALPVSGAAFDDNGHGTHVAGIISGTGSASSGKYTGIAPASKLVGVKVFNAAGTGLLGSLAAGIERAIDPNQDGDFSDKVDIINYSGGSSGCELASGALVSGQVCNPCGQAFYIDSAAAKAFRKAIDQGIIVMVAAGNSGPQPETILFPGCMEEILAVGSSIKPFNINHYVTVKGNLVGAAVDGTWTIENSLAPIPTPSGLRLEVRGNSAAYKMFDDVSDVSEEIHTCGNALIPGNDAYIKTWNWHVSQSNYETEIGSSINPAESPLNNRIFNLPNSPKPTVFATKDDVLYTLVGKGKGAKITSPDGRSMTVDVADLIGPYYYIVKVGFDGVVSSIRPYNSCSPLNLNSESISSSSSRGPANGITKPDLVAPGYCIVSAKARTGVESNSTYLAAPSCLVAETQYIGLSGTSMATPMASGVAALLKQKNSTLDQESARETLKSSADLIDDYGKDDQGSGRVNAWKAFKNL